MPDYLPFQTLQVLHAGVNGFKNKGTIALLDALKTHPALRTVDLCANCARSLLLKVTVANGVPAVITDETGVAVLNVALERKWPTLRLGGNQFSEKLFKQIEGIIKDAPIKFDVFEHAKRIAPANLTYGG